MEMGNSAETAIEEIRQPVEALKNGRPVNFGWAREKESESSLIKLDYSKMRGSKRRIHASDRYIVFSPSCMLMVQVFDGGWIGWISVSLISLTGNKRYTKMIEFPFPMGDMELPETPFNSSIKLSRAQAIITLSPMPNGARIIKIDISQFNRRHLRGELVLIPANESERFVTLLPGQNLLKSDPLAFMLTDHSCCYSAEGVIQYGAEEYVFIRGNSWGIFNWKRGRRSKTSIRSWASASGVFFNGGLKRIGFSLGWGAGAGIENAFFIDGKIYKLGPIDSGITSNAGLASWRFQSLNSTNETPGLEMSFKPHQERDEKHIALFYYLNRRQLFGSFSGRLSLSEGKSIDFENITGLVEISRTRG